MQALKCSTIFAFILIVLISVASVSIALPSETKLQTGEAILIKAPINISEIVAEHVNHIYQGGHAEEISFEDFFHGHLIRKETLANAILPEELFSQVSGILYHTAERNDRWEKDIHNGESFETINHRSIVGRMDGSIAVAYEMLNWDQLSLKRQEQFAIGGTFWVSDIVNQFPGWSTLEWSASGNSSSQKILLDFIGQSYELTVREQFIMLKTPEGRFRTPRGETYEIYLSYYSGTSTRRILGRPEFGFVVNPKVDTFPYEDQNCCHPKQW